VRIVEGKIQVQPTPAVVSDGGGLPEKPGLGERPPSRRPTLHPPQAAELPLVGIIDEAAFVRTFRFDNSQRRIPSDLPGRFVQLEWPIDGKRIRRCFTICSSPTSPTLDLTIKLNITGQLTRRLFEEAQVGQCVRLCGPLGNFYFDPEQHAEPLVLISAGSGITPMMSIMRYLEAIGDERPVWFFYGARREEDILFGEECRRWQAQRKEFHYSVSLSQPSPNWPGRRGRWSGGAIRERLEQLERFRFFVCGPAGMIDEIRHALLAVGVPQAKVHFEHFHTPSPREEAIA
jgi:ferredoxin-NADP reductase